MTIPIWVKIGSTFRVSRIFLRYILASSEHIIIIYIVKLLPARSFHTGYACMHTLVFQIYADCGSTVLMNGWSAFLRNTCSTEHKLSKMNQQRDNSEIPPVSQNLQVLCVVMIINRFYFVY